MSALRDRCTKLRVLSLVVVTAHCINELTSPKIGITHSMIAPSAIISTYVFLGVFISAACFKKYPSVFLEVYGIIACIAIQIAQAYIVFDGLIKNKVVEVRTEAVMYLNAVLPCLVSVLLVLDLVIFLLSVRKEYSPPALPIVQSVPG